MAPTAIIALSAKNIHMGDAAFAILLILGLLAWIVRPLFKGIVRGYSRTEVVDAFNPFPKAPPSRKTYALKAPASGGLNLIEMPHTTGRLFTYQDEKRAAQVRQRLWIRYQDRSGHITERAIEIYHPENDEVLFAWCCHARAPRTFARRSIQSWRLLPEHFEFDPVVNRYWEEEGTRDMSEKLPWLRWVADQPGNLAERYR